MDGDLPITNGGFLLVLVWRGDGVVVALGLGFSLGLGFELERGDGDGDGEVVDEGDLVKKDVI